MVETCVCSKGLRVTEDVTEASKMCVDMDVDEANLYARHHEKLLTLLPSLLWHGTGPANHLSSCLPVGRHALACDRQSAWLINLIPSSSIPAFPLHPTFLLRTITKDTQSKKT